MDIAALTLEDQFPDLSFLQVRYALREANGDLDCATELCQRLLAGAPLPPTAASPAAAGGAAFQLVPTSPHVEAAEATHSQGKHLPQHRSWWPAVPVQEEPIRLPQPATGARRLQQPGVAARPAPQAQLQAQEQAASRQLASNGGSTPTVRVVQRHSKPGQLAEMAASDELGISLQAPPSVHQATASSLPQPADGIHYAAVFLSEASRDRVLQHAPPLHEAVSADHMTLAYRPSLELCLGLSLGSEAALFVEGAACDYRAQALAVQHPSWLPFHSDSVPHITVSVAEGVPASEAGDLVRDARAGVRACITPLLGVKLLHGTVGVRLEDGSVAYSEQELLDALRRLRAPTLRQGAPVRILKRGEAPFPRPPSPATLPVPTPSTPAASQPLPPATSSVLGAPGLVVAQQHRHVAVHGYASSTTAALEVEARSVTAVMSSVANAQPSLDDLLDMLHLADTGTASTAPAASTTAAASRSSTSSKAAAPRLSPVLPARNQAPGLLKKGARAPGTAEQQQQRQQHGTLAPVGSLSSRAMPPPGAQQQPPKAAGRVSFSVAVDVEKVVDEGGSLDLLSSLAARLGGGGGDVQHTSPPPHTLPPPSFSALPLAPQPPQGPKPQPGQQGLLTRPAEPKAPAPARTLADFLPARLAAGPSSQQEPPPLPFMLDTPSPVAPAGMPAGPQAARRPSGIPIGAPPPRRLPSAAAVSTGGYESSSSSAEVDCGQFHSSSPGSPICTEEDLQRAFPGVEPDVLAAALEIHGGDAAEAASFLAALQMEQDEGGGMAPSTSATGPPSYQNRQCPPQPQPLPQQSKPWQGGGSVQRRAGAAGRPGSGGRGWGGGRHGGPKHTGASDPLAVAERQAMSLHLAAKNMYEKAARAAAARGAHALSKELAATSQHHADQGNAARRRANSTAYRTSNSALTNTFKVDLHGLHVEEALQVLERHLVSLGGLGHPGGIILEVVTGLGRHSSAGQPRLLPAVIRFLSDAGYRFDTQDGNTGMVNVFIGC